MIATLDVQYADESRQAVAAAVVFQDWPDNAPFAEHTTICKGVEAYIPGQFFRRELPCLLAVLQKISEPLSAIVIDGYAMLGEKPGLGRRLFEALDCRTPVIGVAKTMYRSALPTAVDRGTRQPLYVTAAGLADAVAAEMIKRMAGGNRIPTLLRRVDELARSIKP